MKLVERDFIIKAVAPLVAASAYSILIDLKAGVFTLLMLIIE